MRDLVQNHTLQLLALLTMEPPTALEANRLRDEKLKVLEAVVAPLVEEASQMAVRAQYGPGVVGGAPMPGYLAEPSAGRAPHYGGGSSPMETHPRSPRSSASEVVRATSSVCPGARSRHG